MRRQFARDLSQELLTRAFELGVRLIEDDQGPASLEAARELAVAIAAAMARDARFAPGYRAAPLHLGGVAALRLYEAGGGMAQLVDGIALLREAAGIVDAAYGQARRSLLVDLATALTRLGEQSSDVEPLHEARDLLARCRPFGAADHRAANASATATLRLGAMSADSSLVEQSARELRQYIDDHHPSGEAADMCDRNLVAILVEEARQLKSERHYRAALDQLEARRTGSLETASERHYAQWLASAQLELAQLELAVDPTSARYAELAIETLSPLIEAVTDPRMRIESLHQLGQARNRVGVARQDPAVIALAIEALKQALALCEVDPHVLDGRRPRLMSDLAGYVLTRVRLSGEDGGIDEARNLYRLAIDAVPVDRAPGLHAQIALGWLDLEFRAGQWEAVVAVGAGIERALELAECDPRLSAGVRHQGARLRAGLADKLACALMAMRAPAEAGAALERARGRRLAVARESWASDPRPMDESGAARVAEAEARLRDALSGDDDIGCRLAWDAWSAARRRAGLDLSTRAGAREALARSAGPDSAFVQLCVTAASSFALIWRGDGADLEAVALSDAAHGSLARIIGDGVAGGGWAGHYGDYLAGAAGSARAWNASISGALDMLGRELLDPIDANLRDAGLAAGATVHLCPPGNLARLPLTAARLADGTRFNERWAAGIVPNAAAVGAVAPESGEMVCLGEWAADPDIAIPLPHAVRECALLVRRVPGMRSLSRNQSTPQRVVDAIRDVRIVHAACHGVYDSDEPGRSGLELAGGARITIARLAAERLRLISCRLVFLSACEAGMSGLTLDADEFVGLPSAFLELGARAVVASLWAVADEAAAAFALRFYELLLDGDGCEHVPPARALADAQSWLRTASTATLEAGGYLSGEDARSIRGGGHLVRLRRSEGTAAAPVDAHFPFAEPTHWAGWALFGQ